MHAIQFVNDIVLAFPSLTLMRQIPDHAEINPALAELLRADRIADPTPSTSAIGGWQSARDLVVRGNPAVDVLMSHVGTAVLQLTSTHFGTDIDPIKITLQAEAWGNIMDDCDFTKAHNHVQDHWSGVYYVDAEGGHTTVEANGALELLDPRNIQPLAGPEDPFRLPFREITIQPKDGLMVVFPSWMKHYVYPYRGDRERISIAFNVKIGFTGHSGGSAEQNQEPA